MFSSITKKLGFGLLEVLISVIILTVGLLGLLTLQNRTLQAAQEGDNLATAAMIAKEMAMRMLANRYQTAQGRSGYLALDIATPDAGSSWASTYLAANPTIATCYTNSATNGNTCCANNSLSYPTNSAQRITGFTSNMYIDHVEMRLWVARALPNGLLKICFDGGGSETSWSCTNTASRVTARNENVYTVKVKWDNILSNATQVYTLQFTAECINNCT